MSPDTRSSLRTDTPARLRRRGRKLQLSTHKPSTGYTILHLSPDVWANVVVTGTEKKDGYTWWDCRLCLDDTIQETKSCQYEESANTRCHQLRDNTMKDTVSVEVELRQIYLSGRRSHHPNSPPWPTKANPNYRAKRADSLPVAAGAAGGGRGGQHERRCRSGGKRVASVIAFLIVGPSHDAHEASYVYHT
jgi:hypothetical protein